MYINRFLSQGHKDIDHNENNFIYSKAIGVTESKPKSDNYNWRL